MNKLFIILIVIILLLFIYICYRNNQYFSALESFSTTQKSLSTYFQNTVDSDDYNILQNNKYHKINNNINNNNKYWNGIWRNIDQKIYAQFIQYNDNLIISFSNSSFIDVYPFITNITNIDRSIPCYNNLFLGTAKLNNNMTAFNSISINCNNYKNNTLGLGLNAVPKITSINISGRISGNIINLYPPPGISINPIPLNLVYKFNNNNNNDYSHYLSPQINSYTNIPDSEFIYYDYQCPTGTKECIYTYQGLNNNACGTLNSNGTCNVLLEPPVCIIEDNNGNIATVAINGIQPCSNNYPIKQHTVFPPLFLETNIDSNSLYLCNYLNYFSSSSCNSSIICFVSNIGNVYTLNYQFFGVLSDENTLTAQSDIIDITLNNENNLNNNKLLPYYRNIIQNYTSSSIQKDTLNAISFTNSDSSSININVTQCKEMINNYKGTIGNKLLSPCIWQINSLPNSSSKNVLNSCPIILNTSSNYNTQKKYAVFNDDGTTNLSLYQGGLNQQLFLENTNIINKSDSYTSINPYIMMTTNIKTINNLYLIPSIDYNGFNSNNKVIRGINKPPLNGKWLIIGFSLNSFDNLQSKINTINFV